MESVSDGRERNGQPAGNSRHISVAAMGPRCVGFVSAPVLVLPVKDTPSCRIPTFLFLNTTLSQRTGFLCEPSVEIQIYIFRLVFFIPA